MIYRITNLREVEQAIRERAESEAAAFINIDVMFATGTVAGIIATQARTTPGTNGVDRWSALPELERQRLRWIYIEVFAKERADDCGAALTDHLNRRADALRCGICDQIGGAPQHRIVACVDSHEFMCPHGQKAEPMACVMDHADVRAELVS